MKNELEAIIYIMFAILILIMVFSVINIEDKNFQINSLEEELKKIEKTKKNNCAMLLNYGKIIHDLEIKNENLIDKNKKLKELLYKNISSYYRRNEDKNV